MKSLKDYRLAKKMTRTELGAAVGVTERYVMMLETEGRTPSFKTASKIAEVLDIDKRDIFLIFGGTKSTDDENIGH